MAQSIIKVDTPIAVQITNTMVHVIAPLSATYSLFAMLFLVVNSNQGPPPTSNVMAGAILAWDLLSMLVYLVIAFTLITMSSDETNWNIQGGAVQPSTFSVTANYST
jgi:hypothetical protein